MKILFIAEKPSQTRLIRKLIEDNKFEHEYDFDYIRFVTHLDDNMISLRKREDGKIYHRRTEANFINLKLNEIEIPTDTYLQHPINDSNKKENINFEYYDEIISICDYDDGGILGFQKYIEEYNLNSEKCKFITCDALTENNIISILKLENLKNFKDIFLETKEKLKNNNFKCSYPRTNDVLKLREKTKNNMNRKEFSDYFDIPYRTIENWEFDENDCPQYLYNLMEYKLKNENFI